MGKLHVLNGNLRENHKKKSVPMGDKAPSYLQEVFHLETELLSHKYLQKCFTVFPDIAVTAWLEPPNQFFLPDFYIIDF